MHQCRRENGVGAAVPATWGEGGMRSPGAPRSEEGDFDPNRELSSKHRLMRREGNGCERERKSSSTISTRASIVQQIQSERGVKNNTKNGRLCRPPVTEAMSRSRRTWAPIGLHRPICYQIGAAVFTSYTYGSRARPGERSTASNRDLDQVSGKQIP